MNHSTRDEGFRLTRHALALALVGAALAASGCNNAGEGALSGTALGALGGLAIGSLTGSAGAGAAIGAVSGAAVGGVIGDQNERNSRTSEYRSYNHR